MIEPFLIFGYKYYLSRDIFFLTEKFIKTVKCLFKKRNMDEYILN